jgi:hypothetical protein
MNSFAHLIMMAWIPAVVALFALLPPRRAVLVAFLFAWLFLPMSSYKLHGLPDYTKMSATTAGAFIGVLLFDTNRLFSFRPRLLDVPMVVWCLCPFATSLSNDLGLYDALASTSTQVVVWGLPYLIGRLYFSTVPALRELAIAIFIGGLIYVPLCLFEVRMFPQLHRIVYGWMQKQTNLVRLGGWRPQVFMQDGLMLSLWMGAASLMGFWLWMTGSLKRIRNFNVAIPLVILVITTLLTRSTGALALLVLAVGVLLAVKYTRSAAPLLIVLAVSPAYMALRAKGTWDTQGVVRVAEEWFGAERAQSLWARFNQENILNGRALQRPILGWGGWNRRIVYTESGRRAMRGYGDGFWVITLGLHGLLGLSAFVAAMLLPPVLFLLRTPKHLLITAAAAPIIAIITLLSVYMLDNLLNAMINPIYTLGVGGLTGIVAALRSRQTVNVVRRQPRPQPFVAIDPFPQHHAGEQG